MNNQPFGALTDDELRRLRDGIFTEIIDELLQRREAMRRYHQILRKRDDPTPHGAAPGETETEEL